MNTKNVSTSIFLAAALSASGAVLAGTPALVLSGRVEAVDRVAGVVTVLGHSVRTQDARRVLLGQLVNVYGSMGADGTLAGATLESVDTYVAGTRSAAKTSDRAAALTGTGDEAQALTGTGDEAQALTGTGDQAQALTGTGDQAQALTGTGDQAQALTGTGDQAEALTGTGSSAE